MKAVALRQVRREKRAQGVQLGRRRQLPKQVVARIVKARARGESFARIADTLNANGVATAQGGKRWYPATVRAVSLSVTAQSLQPA